MATLPDLIYQSISLAILPVIISLLVSYFIARRTGGIAAAEYTQSILQKREHDLKLIEMNHYGLIHYGDHALKMFYEDPDRYFTNQVDDIDEIEDPSTSFFISHLRTGYPKDYENHKKHIRHYKRITADLMEVNRLIDAEFRAAIKGHLNVDDTVYYGRFIQSLVESIMLDLGGGKHGPPKLQDQQVVGKMLYRIQLHGEITDFLKKKSTAQKILAETERLLTDPETLRKYKSVYEDSKKLTDEARKLSNRLEEIKASVRVVVNLKGWCNPGKDAKIEG